MNIIIRSLNIVFCGINTDVLLKKIRVPVFLSILIGLWTSFSMFIEDTESILLFSDWRHSGLEFTDSTTGVTRKTGDAYPSGAPDHTPDLIGSFHDFFCFRFIFWFVSYLSCLFGLCTSGLSLGYSTLDLEHWNLLAFTRKYRIHLYHSYMCILCYKES